MVKRRSKLNTTPIDYDDVVGSPSMQGMVSFLSVPPGQLPQLDFRPAAEIPVLPTTAGTPETGAPDTGVPEKGIPAKGIPQAVPPAPQRRPRIALSAREGHSLGEDLLYETLWREGRPYDQDTRILTAGYRSLSALAGLTVNNCKANLQSLQAKLAIEQTAGSTYTQGRTYLVYSPEEILRRRRSRGLTHVVKTRGVTFIDPNTGLPLALSEG
jgi:hypothetical protein